MEDTIAQQKELAWHYFNDVASKDLPQTLIETLSNVGKAVGMSGDVFLDTALIWIQDGQRRALTYQDVCDIIDSNHP